MPDFAINFGRPRALVQSQFVGQRAVPCSGFSLIEVVIALAIVSFAVISMLGLLILGIKNNRESEQKTVASMIDRDAAVRIREVWLYMDTQPLPPSGASSYTHTFFYSAAGLYLGDNYSTLPASPAALYAATVKLGTLDPSNVPLNVPNSGQLASLTVTIRWPLDTGGNPIGTQNVFNYVTYFAKTSDPAWAITPVTRP